VADLTQLTDEELEVKNQELMAARGEAEQGFKAQQMEIQEEVTRRSDEARLARLADTMSQEQRDALVAYLAEHPPVEVEAPTVETEETPAEPATEG
jgi:hypothetical protein